MLLFGNVELNIVLGSIFLVASWTSCCLLRLLYLLSDKSTLTSVLPQPIRRMLPSASLFPASFRLPPHLCLVLYGQRTVRCLSLLYLLLMLTLAARVNVAISSGSVFQLQETSRGYWACTRMLLSGLIALLAGLLQSHHLMRLLHCALLPGCLLLDLLSLVALTIQLSCPDSITVTPTLSASSSYTVSSLECSDALLPAASTLLFYAWRDVLSSCVGLLLLSMSYWLCGLYGWCGDDVQLWSYEYQHFELDMQRRRQRLRRNERQRKKKTQPLLSALFS